MLTYTVSPLVTFVGVAELADARDLKSREGNSSYRFDPGHRHQKILDHLYDDWVSFFVLMVNIRFTNLDLLDTIYE